ncbi:MAG: M18 family aminopeptidase [Gammaproteobacteria bacterium]|nr:M18 family aminopeptidase [Gammaproteobacteria bacterium]
MGHAQFITDLLDFIEDSPTPFHAVQNMKNMLSENGFAELKESDSWSLLPGQNYYVTRNGSSIIAFRTGATDVVNSGVRMVGAHTDSPCLKVKPTPEIVQKGYLQLGVEVYGGALFSPWFDRDLSLAGRVNYATKYHQLETALIDFKDPIAVIPSLAIHLNRTVHEARTINPQKELLPIILQAKEEEPRDFRELLKMQMLSENPESTVDEVLDYDLYFYDTQPPAIVGLDEEFICSARLDNLLSCFVGLVSLIQAGNKFTSLLICNDHEEVGSMSAAGAQGTFLRSVLERLVSDPQKFSRMIHQSILVSADNAHGVHPNYVDKHDETHGPVLNKGPVIKVNANQRYATNSRTSAVFRHLCKKADVPVQSFSMRNDMACGSTIGPITATELGVQTIDVGVPQFAMHSVRETAGVKDAHYLFRVLKEFYANEFDMD